MTITVHPDRIDFDNYTLRIDDSGVCVTSPTSSDISGIFSAGKIELLSPMYGMVAGYTSGGGLPVSNVIDKFPFASNANATDVGDLTQGRYGPSGQSSSVSGYASGGGPPITNTIDKFPFASNANATDVGDLSQSVSQSGGQSSPEFGYRSGGFTSPAEVSATNVIDRFPFATNANASSVGVLSQTRGRPTGQSSLQSGYNSGGANPSVPTSSFNTIDKFPFAINANATDVGDLTVARFSLIGQSSEISGYTSGGGPPITNTIDKFPFATNANATDVGDLTQGRYWGAGQSSSAFGYSSGGSGDSNVIDRFPFASDANATDVGDLTQARRISAGQQD